MRDYKKEYDKSGFVIIDDFLPKDVYAKMVESLLNGNIFCLIRQININRSTRILHFSILRFLILEGC